MVATPIDIHAVIAARPVPGEPGRFGIDVPDGLQQGRGAWGGVATGAMAAAARLVEPDPGLTLRNLGAQLVAPLLVGQAVLSVRTLRAGSATHTLALELRDTHGELLAHGVAVMGRARAGAGLPDGAPWRTPAPPAELAAGPLAVPVARIGPPLAPDFAQHLEFRPVLGRPFSAATTLETSGWLRPLAPVGAPDAALVAALADAWWVAVMPPMPAPRPVATISYSLDLPGDPATLARDDRGRLEPVFHRGRVIAAREGYASETRELWSAGGELISWNAQTVVVIR